MKADCRTRFAAALACLVLSACATVGDAFDVAAVQHLQLGQTAVDVSRALGSAPMSTTRLPDGSTVQQWQRIVAAPGAVVENRAVAIVFDAQGRLKHIQHLVNVPMNDADSQRLRVVTHTRL